MDQDPAVIKLPLFSKTSKLAAISGQPEGMTYAVVWDACPSCCPAVARGCSRGWPPAARSTRAIDR